MSNAYVITIMDNPKSVAAAKRCIQSGISQNIKIEHFKAVTPKNNLAKLLEENEIYNLAEFKADSGKWSRYDRVVAGFLSHFYCWKKCVENNELTLIFEHDAVITGTFPASMHFDKCITIGKPSYGKFNTPTQFGVNPLIHKKYFGGAHGYLISPSGAKELIAMAKIAPGPTDTFLNLDNFPFLQEYYPWLVEAKDSFTTIQNENGCQAKHNYNETYEII